MKFKIVLVLLCCGWFLAGAQDRVPVELNNTQFNLNILDPGITFEKSINHNQSFTLGTGITLLGDYEEDQERYSVNPFVKASYRNYYPRNRVKKELLPNSGNYVGVLSGYNFDSIIDNLESGESNELANNTYYIGPVWGIQRNYRSGIHLGFSLGAGFAVGNDSDFDFTGLGEFEFGFVIK